MLLMADPVADDTSAWSADGAGGAETIVVPPPTQAVPDLAWSAEEDSTAVFWPEERHRWPLIAAAAIAVVVVAAVIGGAVFLLRPDPAVSGAPKPAAPAAAAPAAPKQPVLEGSYRVDYHTDQTTYRGHSVPPVKEPHAPYAAWWAFRSSCTAAGCTAIGVQLDFDNHDLPHPDSTDTVNFISGEWQDATPASLAGDCGVFVETWSFAPLADGRLQGSAIRTIATDECGAKGNVTETPITLTRVGPLPPALAR